MQAENEQERNAIMNGVWLVRAEREKLLEYIKIFVVLRGGLLKRGPGNPSPSSFLGPGVSICVAMTWVGIEPPLG